jgi:hypothetical protein
MQHLGVRNGTPHVVGDQPVVECVVLARRVLEDLRVERCALVPQACHGPACGLCSAGVSAPMSSTISVPVPSLVKTSARRLSATL